MTCHLIIINFSWLSFSHNFDYYFDYTDYVCAASDTLISLQQNSGNKNVKTKTYHTVLMYWKKKKKSTLFSSSYTPPPQVNISSMQSVRWVICHISLALQIGIHMQIAFIWIYNSQIKTTSSGLLFKANADPASSVVKHLVSFQSQKSQEVLAVSSSVQWNTRSPLVHAERTVLWLLVIQLHGISTASWKWSVHGII